MIKNISADELRNLIKNEKDKLEIIDVREPDEYELIHIKNSKSIPMIEFQLRRNEIDWKKEVVFLCRSGGRSNAITQALSRAGKDISNLQYGIAECFIGGKGENLEILEDNLIERYFG